MSVRDIRAAFIRSPPSDPSSLRLDPPAKPANLSAAPTLMAARQSLQLATRILPSGAVELGAGSRSRMVSRAAASQDRRPSAVWPPPLRHREALQVRHHPAAVLRLDVLPQLPSHHGRRDAPQNGHRQAHSTGVGNAPSGSRNATAAPVAVTGVAQQPEGALEAIPEIGWGLVLGTTDAYRGLHPAVRGTNSHRCR